MEDLGGPAVTMPKSSGGAVCGDGDFPTPSDAADLMGPPDVGATFVPVEGEAGMAGKVDEQAEPAQVAVDLSGSSGSDPCGFKQRRSFGPVEEEEGMTEPETEGRHETVDLTCCSGMDEKCSSVPCGYKKRIPGAGQDKKQTMRTVTLSSGADSTRAMIMRRGW